MCSHVIICLLILSFAILFFFFFNDTATTEIYTLSLHDALPIWFAVTEFLPADAVTHAPVAGYVITLEEEASGALPASEFPYPGALPEDARPPEKGAARIYIDSIAFAAAPAILKNITDLSILPALLA